MRRGEGAERSVVCAFTKQLPEARQIRPRPRRQAKELEFGCHLEADGPAVEAFMLRKRNPGAGRSGRRGRCSGSCGRLDYL